MKINIHTDIPQELLNAIIQYVDNNTLKTWMYKIENNQILFYHDTASKQWSKLLYLKATKKSDRSLLIFEIADENGNVDFIDFENNSGYIIGRFIQNLIIYFQKYFSEITLEKT